MDIFLRNAGSNFKRGKENRKIQLRIIYTLLFFAGIRTIETKFLTLKDFLQAMENGEFSILTPKTNSYQKHILTENGREALKGMKLEIETFFARSPFLGSSKAGKVFSNYNYNRLINTDLEKTQLEFQLAPSFTSESFRNGFLTRIKKQFPIKS